MLGSLPLLATSLRKALAKELDMRNNSYAQQKISELVTHLPGAVDVLRAYGIDATSQLPLGQAAIAAAVEVDEVLAALEVKARRLAQTDTRMEHANEIAVDIDDLLKSA